MAEKRIEMTEVVFKVNLSAEDDAIGIPGGEAVPSGRARDPASSL